MDKAERGLYDLLLDRLKADDAVDDRTSDLILAAWAGGDELAATCTGGPGPAVAEVDAPAREPSPEMYLAAIHVQGFRGIGAPATLPLRPGPGLTLVTGRNGSGKSSFAEAAELVLTGQSKRWEERTAVWREGWRNLHADGPAIITADLILAGTTGTTRVRREWGADAALDGGSWTRQNPSAQNTPAQRLPFDGSAWRDDMHSYRPFLSYGELGALIDGKPSALHDALHNLLGLGALTDTHDRIRAARKPLADAAKAVTADRRALHQELVGSDDPRIQRAAELLKPTQPDLTALARLITGTHDSDSAVLDALAALTLPDEAAVTAIVEDVRAASDAVARQVTTPVNRADAVASMLRTALRDHAKHGPGTCPVCERGDLDEAWREHAIQRVDALESDVAELRKASAELRTVEAAARALATPVPKVLELADDAGAAWTAWAAWSTASTVDGAAALAHALDHAYPEVSAAVTAVRDRARQELGRRDDIWAPVARRLSAWHDAAREVAETAPLRAAFDRADKWLTGAASQLRDERMAPFAEQSQTVWQTLRQQSNVELGPVRLDGAHTSTRRRVAMDVRIDGASGATALGVMSQGELHALGLSLFLPRATVEHSPFRFILIDDPVQAMDPAKVDGLARVLADVSATRQVVVFTHDDRLADAVRRLAIPATVWEIHRGERSAVEPCPSNDPVDRYLDDARAMARTKELPADIRSELVASCCRSAVEAACHARIRTVRLTRGETHAAVEEALIEANTTQKKAALAMFDDSHRGGDVLPALRSQHGSWAAAALQNCKQGAHHGLPGDLRPFVEDTRRLAEWLAG